MGSLTSVWPGLGVAMSSMAMGTGDVGLTASSISRWSTGAEFDSLIFSLPTSPKASPYSMDDKDPRKFFMPGERKWVRTKGMGRPPGGPDSVSPSPQASLVTCPVPASSSAPAFLCSPTGHCRNLDRCTQGADPRRIPNISLHFLGPTLRT